MLGEDINLSHELDLVVTELDELVHHPIPFLLSLLTAFACALAIFQLSVILLWKIFSHLQYFLFCYLFDVNHEAANVHDVAVLNVRIIFGLIFILRNSLLSAFTFT